MSSDQSPDVNFDNQALLITNLTRDYDKLLAYIYSLVHNWQDAQDVLQKTSLVLWKKFDQFDPDTKFMSWATRVAFYEARNFLRIAGRDRHCFGDELLDKLAKERSGDLDHGHPRIEALRGCLAKLTSADQEILRRVYNERDSVDQLAEETGRATQTIYNKLYKLRQQLLACIERNLKRETFS